MLIWEDKVFFSFSPCIFSAVKLSGFSLICRNLCVFWTAILNLVWQWRVTHQVNPSVCVIFRRIFTQFSCGRFSFFLFCSFIWMVLFSVCVENRMKWLPSADIPFKVNECEVMSNRSSLLCLLCCSSGLSQSYCWFTVQHTEQTTSIDSLSKKSRCHHACCLLQHTLEGNDTFPGAATFWNLAALNQHFYVSPSLSQVSNYWLLHSVDTEDQI